MHMGVVVYAGKPLSGVLVISGMHWLHTTECTPNTGQLERPQHAGPPHLRLGPRLHCCSESDSVGIKIFVSLSSLYIQYELYIVVALIHSVCPGATASGQRVIT